MNIKHIKKEVLC